MPERGRRRPRTGSPTTAAVGPERHSRPPSGVFRVVPRRPAGRRAAVDAGFVPNELQIGQSMKPEVVDINEKLSTHRFIPA